MAVKRPDVLVLRALGLGDLLTSVPALRGLRRAYPDATITLAAPQWLADLVADIDAVDRLLPTSGLVTLDWSGSPPVVAVNLHGRGPQSLELLRRLRPRRLIGHAHPAHPEVDGPAWKADQHEVRRWCRLLAHHGIAADADDLTLPARPSPAPGMVVVHPGASHAARRWPAERYGEVAAWLAARGAQVVVTGSAAERPVAEAVARTGGLAADRVLAGRTGLSALAALVAHARMVVCGDTGTAHLATAYGTPSVVLFGPVAPRHWGPPGHRPQHRALWAGEAGDTFADRPAEGLLRISVNEVIESIQGIDEHWRVRKGGGGRCARTGSAWWEPATSG